MGTVLATERRASSVRPVSAPSRTGRAASGAASPCTSSAAPSCGVVRLRNGVARS